MPHYFAAQRGAPKRRLVSSLIDAFDDARDVEDVSRKARGSIDRVPSAEEMKSSLGDR